MSIGTKASLVILISLIIGTFAIIMLLNKAYDDDMLLIAEETVRDAEEAFNNLENQDINKLSATLEALLADDNIRNLYLQKDGDKLYHTVQPVFTNLRKKFGITHWYFITPPPDSRVFLRVHAPRLHGDIVRRATYLKSVRTKGFGAGMELGNTAFALRVTHPYYENGGKLIGFMELGEDINHFLKIMKKQTGNEYGLLIEKKYLNKRDYNVMKRITRERNNWDDNRDMVLIDKTSDDERLISYQGEIEKIPAKGIVSQEIHWEKKVFIQGIFPVIDVAGRKMGGVFVVKDITTIHKRMESTMIKAAMFIALITIIIATGILLILNKLVFARLDRMVDVATRVVGGDYETKIVPSANDEVGRFEALFEQFRVVFVNMLNELEKKSK